MVYSVDLRKRVIEAIQQGMSIKVAIATFKVSRKTIYIWSKKLEANGHLEPKTGYQKGHSHKITNWDQFKEFAYKNQRFTVLQMVPNWKELTGINLSESTMLAGLKKINFTPKKKHFVIAKLTKKNNKNL